MKEKTIRRTVKPKAVNFELLEEGNPAFKILADVRKKWHQSLHGAFIALAWRKALNADVDGRLVLGKCVKVSDLHKEFAQFDFVILLNKEVWNNPDFSEEQKQALIDHELCHAAPAEDKYGFQREDERGRKVWRIRKHDIEEFRDVVKRHGCYKSDLERFAEALMKSKQMTLMLRQEVEILKTQERAH